MRQPTYGIRSAWITTSECIARSDVIHRAMQFDGFPRSVVLHCQDRFVGQGNAIFRRHDLLGQPIQSVLGKCIVLLGTENQPHGWVHILKPLMLPGIVQVDVRLAGVGVGEAAAFRSTTAGHCKPR